MKAVRQNTKHGPVSIADIPEPTLRDGSVTVRVEAAGVLSYHRDVLSGKLGYAVPPSPYTPGTDAVGTIEAVGNGVFHTAVGNRVAIDPRLFSHENVSEPEGLLLGLTGLTPGAYALQEWVRDGTWAEKIVVPAEMVTPLPAYADTPAERLACLHKFVVCYGGLIRGRLSGGETVVILGATGNFGAPAVPLAIAMGASRVTALGRNQSVLAQLGKLDARIVPLALTGDVEEDSKAIRDAVPGGADMALDLVGHATDSKGIQAMLGGLRTAGRLVIQGSMGVPLELPYGSIMARSIEILGAFMYPRDTFRRLAAMVDAGTLDLGCTDVHAFPLEKIDEALDAAASLKGLSYVVVIPN